MAAVRSCAIGCPFGLRSCIARQIRTLRVAYAVGGRYVVQMRVGLITDTHLPSLMYSLDELGSEVADFLSTVELILHAGDVTAPRVIEWCEQFAPVRVARGNNDLFEHPAMEDVQLLEIEGWRIGMVHELRPESRPMRELLDTSLGGEEVDILIGGDTHVERLEYRDSVLLINSGSPNLPHHKETRLGTLGLLELEKGRVHAEIIHLGHTEGMPNPAIAKHLEIHSDRIHRASMDGQHVEPHEYDGVVR